jgi:replication-associated recombination protein RarA
MTQPKSFNQVIGNVAAIERIKSAIAENSGLGGCVFFLQGETGNGKTMFADIIADLADGDVYRAECNNGDEVAKYMDEIKTHAKTPPLCGGLSRVYDTFPSGRGDREVF